MESTLRLHNAYKEFSEIACTQLCNNTVISIDNCPSYKPRLTGASPGFGRGGPRIFFSDLGICMSRSDMLRIAKPCALLGGSGTCPPVKIF